MTQSPVVRLQDVTKKIGSRTIIDRISLEVYPGEVFGFLGPNGSGKTTTIRMMVGLMSITSGDILIGGHSIRKEFPQAIRQVGAIVENPELYRYLTGYQNLVHFARMAPGISRSRIDEVVRLVGMESRIHDKVKRYSLGMRQRLGVAQAVLHRPRLLVLDEPTNGLDPAGIRELRDYLRKLAREEGTAVFVSSHLLSEMELMCDRVAILQKGRVVDIRAVRRDSESSEAAPDDVWFDVERPEEALRVLDGLGKGRIEDGRLAVTADRKTVAEINRKLVEAGFSVYGIRVKTKTLEDQFLEVTRGESVG